MIFKHPPPITCIMFRLVVFDMDGTLLDTKKGIMESINSVFSEMGLGPYDWKKDIERFFGKRFRIWAETLLKEGGKYSRGNTEKMVNMMFDLYEKTGVRHARLTEGALETLKHLRSRGIRIAVSTNMIRALCTAMFEKFNLYGYVDTMCTLSDVKREKPFPDQMDLILSKHDIPKEETLMVGDSVTDAEFAKNSGVRLALLDQPWNRELKADYRIRKLAEITSIVG